MILELRLDIKDAEQPWHSSKDGIILGFRSDTFNLCQSSGQNMIFLAPALLDWSIPWWTWLVVGVVVLMLVTCCTIAVLRSAGVITDDRTVK